MPVPPACIDIPALPDEMKEVYQAGDLARHGVLCADVANSQRVGVVALDVCPDLGKGASVLDNPCAPDNKVIANPVPSALFVPRVDFRCAVCVKANIFRQIVGSG